MFLYDLCISINPSVKEGTVKRFGYSWIELFRNRHEIHQEELALYENEAKEKGMKNSYQWIHYNELTIGKKGKFVCQMSDQACAVKKHNI